MERPRPSLWSYRLAGVWGGLLLCAGNLYGPLVVLQLAAFVPLLVLAVRRRPGREALFLAGLYMGLAYSLPQMAALRFPAVTTLVLLAKMTAFLCVLVILGGVVIRCGVLGPWLFAAVVVVGDWANFATPPPWGTAQSLARAWSAYPSLIGLAGWTGITGVVFMSAFFQGLAAHLLAGRSRKGLVWLLLVPAVAVVAGGLEPSEPISMLRVAAIGWADATLDPACDPRSPQGFNEFYAAHVAEAARKGARLVVSPELAFEWGGPAREAWVNRFTALAMHHRVHLVVAYFDEDAGDNRLVIVSDRGEIVGHYVKTHLTPFEPFVRGRGEPLQAVVDGIRVGVMICNDDNFTDISRRYGRRGVQVMAVPTLDWASVSKAHFQNSIHRAIESHYAVVRAARNGISAIVSPRGRVLARSDHLDQGIGLLVADVPVGLGPTLFSRAGHWPVAACAVFLASMAALALLRRRLAVESGHEAN